MAQLNFEHTVDAHYFQTAPIPMVMDPNQSIDGRHFIFLFILGMIVFSHDYNLSEKFYPLYNSLSDHYTFHALIGSASARIQLAKTAIQLALNNPLFGVGPLHFSYYDPGDIAAHPHNSILLIASEWGIPAALCVSMLLVNGFTQWIKMQKNKMLKQTDKQTISMILTVSLIAELIYSLMSGVTITPLSQIVFVLILGWMLGLYHRSDKKIIESTNIHCYLFSLTIMISTLLLLSLSIVVTHNLPQKEIQWYFQQQTGQKHFYPRFWVQGELR